MTYTNAHDLLPPELVAELQKFAAGQVLYIPRPPEGRRPWGHVSGERERLRRRNAEIHRLKQAGSTIDELAERFCLSPDGIRKVLYRTTPP